MFEQPARQQVIALVVLSGDLPEVDVDRAAFELERAGYRVTRLPDKMAARLHHPLDDFLEALIEIDGPADNEVLDGIMEQVNAIVDPYDRDLVFVGGEDRQNVASLERRDRLQGRHEATALSRKRTLYRALSADASTAYWLVACL